MGSTKTRYSSKGSVSQKSWRGPMDYTILDLVVQPETIIVQSNGVAAVAEWLRHWIVAGLVTSSLVPLRTRRVGNRSTLNLSRAQTSFRWCGS
ncbi:hypothetical protein TNCV_1989181 [Trichonephila clavipes]|nr:hypothetical protein TNCV_1989181 [Trichonephila clavipes]